MTSKEALETLFDVACNREHTNSEHSFWLKAYRVIKNDLEVLEIIRKNMMILPYHNKNKKYESIALCMTFVGEDVEKIKELLE